LFQIVLQWAAQSSERNVVRASQMVFANYFLSAITTIFIQHQEIICCIENKQLIRFISVTRFHSFFQFYSSSLSCMNRILFGENLNNLFNRNPSFFLRFDFFSSSWCCLRGSLTLQTLLFGRMERPKRKEKNSRAFQSKTGDPTKQQPQSEKIRRTNSPNS
jgi:hypothetical protein